MKSTHLSGRRLAVLAAAGAIAIGAASGTAHAQIADTSLQGLTWDPTTMTFDTFQANSWAEMATFNWAAADIVTISTMNGLGRRVLFNVDPANGASSIGSLAAGNHFVYIANPAGVTLSGALNVGGLYAVAGAPTFTETDFVNGNLNNTYQFDTTAGGLLDNAATITASGGNGLPPMVHLLGDRVINSGVIVLSGADAVVTMLADDTSITLRELANGRVAVRLDTTDITDANGFANANVANAAVATTGMAGVTHTGSISASGGGSMRQVVLGAGDMYALAIDNNGVIDATGGTVQMTGIDKAVRHQGTLKAATLNVDAAQIRLDADVNADTATFANETRIGTNITIEGAAGGGVAANMVTFESLINGTGGIARDLTVNSTNTIFGDNVGSLFPLAKLTVTGDAIVSRNITTTGPGGISFGGNVSFIGAGIAFGNQTIDAGAGVLNFDGNATKTALGNLTLSGAGGITLAGNASTVGGDLIVNNDLTLNGAGLSANQSLTTNGGLLDLNGTVTKTTTGSMTLDAGTGIMDAEGNITHTQTGFQNTITLRGSGGIQLAGDVTTNAATLQVAHALTLDGAANQALTTNDGLLDLDGDVTKTMTGGTLTLDSGLGMIDVEGDVAHLGGANTDNIAINSLSAVANAIALGGNATTNGGNLTIMGNVQLDGAGLSANQRLDGGSGLLLIDGPVVKTTTGNLTLGGATSLTLKGDVTVDIGDLTIEDAFLTEGNLTASNNVTLMGNAQLDSPNTLITATNGTLTTANLLTGPVGNLTLTGGAGIVLNGDVTVGGFLTVNNAFTSSGNILALSNIMLVGPGTLNGGPVQQIQSAFATLQVQQALTKITPGTLILGGGALGNVDLNADVTVNAGDLQIWDAFTSTGNLNAMAGITLLQNGTLDGVGVNQRIDAGLGSLFAQGLTKTGAGNLTLGGGAGLFLSGNVAVNSGDLTLEDLFTTAGDLTASNNVTLMGNGTLNGVNQQITATAGMLDIDGSLMKLTPGTLALTAGTIIDAEGDITHMGPTPTDTMTLTAAAAGNNIMLAGNNVTTLGGTLTVNGNVLMDGGNQTLASTAAQLILGGNVTKTTNGNAVFAGPGGISLAGNAVYGPGAVGNMTFNNSLTLNGVGNQRVDSGAGALTLNGTLTKITAGNIALGGATGVTLNGAVAVNAGGLTVEDAATLGANVSTTAGQNYQAAVTLANSVVLTDTGAAAGIVFGSTVDGPFALAVNTAGNTTFVGNVGGTASLASLTTGVQGFLLFQGNLVQTTGNVSLNESIVIPVPATATIGASGNILFSAGGNYAMGQNQKLSSLGSVSIVTNSATLGDINTLGDLIVTANSIQLLSRQAGNITGDTLPDRGLDFVAGGKFFFSAIPTVVGGGIVQFANPLADGDALGTLRTYIMRAFGPVTSSMIFPTTGDNAGVYLDLRAKGPSNTNIGEAFASVIPPDTQQADVNQNVPLPATIRDILAQSMNIPARVLGPQELAELVVGRSIYLDAPPESSVDDRIINERIAENRVLTEAAIGVVDAYEQLNAADRGIDQVRFDLGVAWRIYRRTVGEASTTPDGFLAFCQSEPGNEQILADLAALNTLLENMQVLGLTDAELQLPVDTVLSLFASPDLPARTLESVLNAMGATETAMNVE
ncbi:MAG: hypothetical protein GY715_09195 [Planctomycetes bacterium]|nr:hypothetical protein [Planctomycetota bacterium]